MKLKQIYDLIVQEGIKADPRLPAQIEHKMKMLKEHFHALPDDEKQAFDDERLRNPYDDTRLLYGDLPQNIKTIMVGIDIDTSELLLVKELNKNRKQKIDLVIAHHPQGRAYANFYEVMDMQADIFNSFGVPINISEKLVEERKREVSRRIHSANHYRTADAARLLDIPFLCMHTPADNHVQNYLQNLMAEKKPQTLKEIIRLLHKIEEYKNARKQGGAPMILLGNPDSRTGKIFVDMTGGTEGPKEIIDSLLQAGVGTLIGMHLSEEHYKKFKEKNINVVVAGHIASDTLGMNLICDKLQRAAQLNILTCSGFRRIHR